MSHNHVVIRIFREMAWPTMRLLAFPIQTSRRTRTVARSLRGRSRESGLGGFTLVELLVVVVIIGILAALALPRIAQAIETAKQGRTVARLQLIRGGANMYFSDHGISNSSEMSYYPWEMIQLFHHDEFGNLQGCTLHTPPHYYLENSPDYAEEVGDGQAAGYQMTSWCNGEVSGPNVHAFHLQRKVQSVDDGSPASAKGGYNWCIPGGAGAPTGAPSGTVWIDENVMMFSGTNANWM